MPDCTVCRELPTNVMERLNEEIARGEKSAIDLGHEYGCEAAAVARHAAECIAPNQSDGYSQLTQTLGVLNGLLEQFGQDVANGKQYQFDAEAGIDGRKSVDHLLSVMREMRETTMAMERLRSVDATMGEVMEQVINPLSHWAATFFADECRRFRDELHTVTREIPAIQPRIRKMVDDFAIRLAEGFLTGALQDMPDKMKEALSKTYAKGTRQPNRPRTH